MPWVGTGQLKDRRGAGGDQRRNSGGGDGAGIGIHIGEQRLGAEQDNPEGSSDEGTRRGDQLITGPRPTAR
jgi:hypothetical protein